MAHHLQARPVTIDSEGEPAGPDPPVVALQVALALEVGAARTERPAGLVLHLVGTGVSDVEVPASVGADDERMEPVVVIPAAEAGKEDLLLVRLVVAVLIYIKERRGGAGDHDVLAQHRDAERGQEVLVLDEHLR